MNFAMNSSGLALAPKRNEENEVEALEKIYGPLFNKMRRDATSDELPIDEKLLSRLSISGGMCCGASLDFISRYVKMGDGDSSEKIKKISAEVTDQGTPEGQITQILHRAQPPSQKIEDLTQQAKKGLPH